MRSLHKLVDAACHARSRSEFVAKMGVVLEEADETQLWLELIIESKLLSSKTSSVLVYGSERIGRDLCSHA